MMHEAAKWLRSSIGSVVHEAVRLGDILIAAGRVKVPDIERALMRQRMTGLRVGASLVDAGVVDLDEIARALARQHGVPAAFCRHLASRDTSLDVRLPANIAREAWALPIAMSRGANGMAFVVCFRDPTAEIIAGIAAIARCEIIPSVACELVLRRELERAYPLRTAADAEAVDVSFDDSSLSHYELDEYVLVGLDDQRVTRDESQNLMMPHLRQSSQMGVAVPVPVVRPPPSGAMPNAPSLPAVTVAPPTVGMPAVFVPPPSVPLGGPTIPGVARVSVPAEPLSLDGAIARLAAAASRDAVADIALEFLRGEWRAGAVLIIKEGMLLGHRGFGGALTSEAIESIMVPLNQPSFLRTVHDERKAFLGDAPMGSIAQDRFMRLFALVPSKSLVAAPVIVRERVVCLLFALGPIGMLAELASSVSVLGQAMAAAYLRLIIDAKRQG